MIHEDGILIIIYLFIVNDLKEEEENDSLINE